MSPTEHDPLPGSRLGRYRILGKLGQGGMGVVYHAIQEPLELEVALKLPLPEAIADPTAREVLLNEARTAAQLKHPNICTILDVGEAEGRVYISMEYIEGKCLADRIPPLGLPDETVVPWGARLARALAHAHKRGVIHRDIRPANVVLTDEGVPKLLDFGLSRRVLDAALGRPALEHDGALVGVPLYLSPEVLSGEADGVASDLWALGVMLYEMSAGRVPFTADSPGGLVKAILLSGPPTLPEHTGRGLSAVLQRCLAKDPAQRFHTADELAAALEAIGPDVRARRRRRLRNRRIWMTLALLPVLALFVPQVRESVVEFLGLKPVDPTTVQVLPMEVQGQVNGAEFAGRAFAMAVALNLMQDPELHLLPVPGSGPPGSASPAHDLEFARRRGAGRLVSGWIAREGDSVRVALTLTDVLGNKGLWAADRTVRADDLPQMASALAQQVAHELGGSRAARYDYFMYDTGPPEIATSPEMSAALGALRRYEIGPALEATRRLVARFPNQSHARTLRVIAMFLDARYEPPGTPKAQALDRQLDTLHTLDPRSPWYEGVRALRVAPGDTRGLAMLSEVLNRPDLTPAARAAVLASRADVFGLAFHDSVGALSDAQAAIKLDPASDLALSTLARWLAKQHRYGEAAERMRQAIALNPTVVNYWHQLGNCLLRQGQWKECMSVLQQAIKLSPNPDELLSAQSDGLACLGHWPEAAASARQALALRADPSYAVQYGLCRMRLGEWEGAATVLKQACAAGSTAACGFAEAAEAVRLARAGDEAGAHAAAERAATAPASKSIAYALACYHAQRGDREAALATLEGFPSRLWVEPGLAATPNFAGLEDEPRFKKLAKAMHQAPVELVFDSWLHSR